ncbi:hypothetical protein HLH36_12220 [Gluconacetobacter aggeris]|uniref:Uncharacterized protein n=1 Tax=Gluconacetobacter aggeris TaxID=1286186 RepID=A0A7W4IUD1_9PROT|nr:hypothetical protein [Gluconacetobacter aggeris]MBB2169113.1 hypothetical protein [Gluconacetobacter aggeris]
MQRHLSTGSTLISSLLAHDRTSRPSPRRDRPLSPSPWPDPTRPPLESRSGHRLGALIQIIAQGHADMME